MTVVQTMVTAVLDASVHVQVTYPAPTDGTRVAGVGPIAAVAGACLPVVLILPGFGCGPASYTDLAHCFATAGYVAVTYAYLETLGPPFGQTPQGGGVSVYGPGGDLAALSAGQYGTREPCRIVRPLVDMLTVANSNPSSPLYNALDLQRIALFGHSAGAALALSYAGRDWLVGLRVIATWGGHALGTALAGWTPGQVAPLGTSTPVLVAGGAFDGVIGAALSQGRYGPRISVEDCLRLTALEAGPLSRSELLPNASHFTIANNFDQSMSSWHLETASGTLLRTEADLHIEAMQVILDFVSLHMDNQVK